MLGAGNTFLWGPCGVRRNPNHKEGYATAVVKLCAECTRKRALILAWVSQKDLLREEAWMW